MSFPLKKTEPGNPAPSNAAHAYFSFRLKPTFFFHLLKAALKQHHTEMLPLFRPLIPEDAVVLDVGAHAGQFAKLFAKLAKRGQVFACEPGTYARTILRVALWFNGIRNATVLPLALGSSSGVGTLTVPVKKSGSYGFGLSHMGSDEREAEIEVIPVVTLDALAETLKLSRLDFVKADIEGFELRFIEGARKTLQRFKPALLLELDGRFLPRACDTLEAAWQTLNQLGYRAYEPTPERTPIPAPRSGDVLWLAK